jgi:lysophospholipase L1-like esterase
MRRQLLVLVLGTCLLAGCSGRGDDEPVAAAARTTAPPAPAPTGYEQYVALGDSYTAAPLVSPTDTSTVCLRSEVNYPALVAADMPGTALTDVSCSGARTGNATSPQSGLGGSVPPQFDALRASTDLVTVGLGGNDEGLFATVLGRCTRLASADPRGAPCRAELDRVAEPLDETLATIRHNIASVVDGIRKRSPDARILVVGYPQIVPASGTCDLLPLATGDYPFARSVNEGLTRAVRLGAEDAEAEYVDLWAATSNHDICATDPWINGRITSADTALAYHPLAVEQRAVADIVLETLRT